ncbi:amidase [Motilibacter rhizosphaerae]|uniref:Amidase n=1 Tax=Motilibacter rhizosphaerae TaxID=598652 RepID=A0A4Q7NZ54_9ACTN|nr:amidase [Motilibacter rhizosphaerae]RZS91702.1 amidase [Motilibacter rhizosphaerae]
MSALAGLPAVELARLVREREVTVPQVVEDHLARIDETDGVLHAFVAVRAEAVRAEARDAQLRLDAGEPVGPLHGVPFTAKDVLATSDPVARAGSLAAPPEPTPDATAVQRMRAAGALLLGKTACPELAFGVDTVSPVSGATGSPWGEGLTPGGSSGGEAAAVASGMSAVGLGTDYGGSLRWPAACVGILAVRPTVGLVPGTGQLPGLPGPGGRRLPDPWSLQGALQVVGPLARTVDDLALALDVLAGPDGWDPAVRAAAPVVPPGPGVEGLRVGWVAREDSTPVRRDVAVLVARAVALLGSAGAEVEHRPGLLDGAHAAYNAVRDADGLDDLRRWVSGREHLLGPELQLALARPQPLRSAYAEAWAAAAEPRQRILAALGAGDEPGLDLLVCPVAPVPAFRRGVPVEVEGQRLAGFDLMALCRAVTLPGLPSLSVPVGLSEDGLPVSVQLVARPYAEPVLLAAARVLTAAVGPLLPPPPAS